MYRSFNLTNVKITDRYFDIGNKIYSDFERQAKTALSSYISDAGVLNGSKMQEDWFPQVNADIFISHSHSDRDNAICLAGWLKNDFNLVAFVDSCIWGNSNELLRAIDNKHCMQPDNVTYNYQRRNESTSHVHMMLSVALTKMIDKTECLFFLNTPSSVKSYGVDNKTSSPWIYAEISMAQMVSKPLELHHRLLSKTFSKSRDINESVQIDYNINLRKFVDLSPDDLNKWNNQLNRSGKESPLDILYKLNPLPSDIFYS